MKKPPSNRQSFVNDDDELDYLYEKMSYWLRIRHDRKRAMAFASRFENLLRKLPPDDPSITSQEQFVLLFQLKHDVEKMIVHLQRAIAGTKEAVMAGTHLGRGLVLPPNWPRSLGYPRRAVDYRLLARLLTQLADAHQKNHEPILAAQAMEEATSLARKCGFKVRSTRMGIPGKENAD